jgi:isopentenyldiphosphate isomerase
MNEEYFDVLTENGEFTGEIATREECHSKGLWHKGTVLFIVNSKNEILLQLRTSSNPLWIGLWDVSAGGHVDAGEFSYEAVIRETKEELGITADIKDCTFIGCCRSTNIKGDVINNHFNEYYILKKDINIEDLKVDPIEVKEVRWFKTEDLINRINNNFEGITTKIGCWNCLKRYLEKNKSSN